LSHRFKYNLHKLSIALFLVVLFFNSLLLQAQIVDRNTPTKSGGNNANRRIVQITNPVLDKDFQDPTVIRSQGGKYYAYATEGNENGKRNNNREKCDIGKRCAVYCAGS
jgi:hypothetical protein